MIQSSQLYLASFAVEATQLESLQLEIIKKVQTIHSPVMDHIFEGVTMLGEEVIAILLASFILWCLSKKQGFRLAFVLLSGLLINTSLKEAFDVKRPIGMEGVRSLRTHTATGKSFPSGHTQMVTMLFTWLAFQVKRPAFTVFSVISILSVAVSRVYLGVHWPTDVIASVVIGVLWVALSLKFMPVIEDNVLKSAVLITAVSWLGAAIFYSHDYMKVLGMMTGLMVSMLVQDLYINFEPTGTRGQKSLMFLVGILGVIGILLTLKTALPKSVMSDTLRYAVMVFWIGAILPAGYMKVLDKLKSKSS